MKEQTIILTATAVITVVLIGSVLSNAPATYAKTFYKSQGNTSTPSNQSSSNNNGTISALSLSNPALNNLQPLGGQNNTTIKALPGLVNLAPGGGKNNTNPTNQKIIKTLPGLTLPGLTQLVPRGQNNTGPGSPTKLPNPGLTGITLGGNLTNNPGARPGNNTLATQK